MFLQRTTSPKLLKDGSIAKSPTVRYEFECDHCKMRYERQPGHCKIKPDILTFCSNACKFESFKVGGQMRQLSVETSMQRYGSTPMKSKEVLAKRAANFKAKYGDDVSAPLHVPGAKAKRKRTHLERYGVEETFQLKMHRSKREQTWMKRYGVPYKPFDQSKVHEAMLNHPQKWSSKIEEDLCVELIKLFGSIIRQKRVHKWPVDAYIPSIDTYVQLDGVYWHGLDRPIDVIGASDRPRDRAIFQKWLNDREQDEWFANHYLKLIRITDIEFKTKGFMTSPIRSS